MLLNRRLIVVVCDHSSEGGRMGRTISIAAVVLHAEPAENSEQKQREEHLQNCHYFILAV